MGGGRRCKSIQASNGHFFLNIFSLHVSLIGTALNIFGQVVPKNGCGGEKTRILYKVQFCEVELAFERTASMVGNYS